MDSICEYKRRDNKSKDLNKYKAKLLVLKDIIIVDTEVIGQVKIVNQTQLKRALVEWKIDLKKLSRMQHRQTDIYNIEDRNKRHGRWEERD